MDEARDRQVDFLLEEYRLITESMLRNEEAGEKRAAFYMTLVGAAATVFVFAFGGDHRVVPSESLPAVVAGFTAVVLVFGAMTIRRMAERHVVTDRHLFALRDIRRRFVSAELAEAMPNAFGNTYKSRPTRTQRYISIHKGGWMECVAAVNATIVGVCLGVLIALKYPYWPGWSAAALVSALAMWIVQISLATRYVAREAQSLRKTDEMTATRNG